MERERSEREGIIKEAKWVEWWDCLPFVYYSSTISGLTSVFVLL